MEPITININLNLSDEHVSQICGAIGCLAQIIDMASRTAGTPFPAQVNMTQHGANSTQVAQVANAFKRAGDAAAKATASLEHAAGSAAEAQQKPENAAETQQVEPPEEPKKPQHTTDDVRNLVITLTHGGYKKEAAALVHKYAAKVTEVPESALDELYAALEKLGGNDGTDA